MAHICACTFKTAVLGSLQLDHVWSWENFGRKCGLWVNCIEMQCWCFTLLFLRESIPSNSHVPCIRVTCQRVWGKRKWFWQIFLHNANISSSGTGRVMDDQVDPVTLMEIALQVETELECMVLATFLGVSSGVVTKEFDAKKEVRAVAHVVLTTWSRSGSASGKALLEALSKAAKKMEGLQRLVAEFSDVLVGPPSSGKVMQLFEDVLVLFFATYFFIKSLWTQVYWKSDELYWRKQVGFVINGQNLAWSPPWLLVRPTRLSASPASFTTGSTP